MKRSNRLFYSIIVIGSFLIISCAKSTDRKKNDAKLSKDQSFDQITIGNQIWMSENLNVAVFQNGAPIPEAKSIEEWKKAAENKQPAWCYYNNDPRNGATLGKLYNGYALHDPRGLAPNGWHIPTDLEWTTLSNFLGGSEVAGKKLKSPTKWNSTTNEANIFRFSGLAAGGRSPNGVFLFRGISAQWWCSEKKDSCTAWSRSLDHSSNFIFKGYSNLGEGLSVRCLKNQP